MLSNSYDYSRIVTDLVKGERNANADLLRGFIAGAIGGLVGTGLKTLAERLFPPRPPGEDAPPIKIADELTEATVGEDVPEEARPVVAESMHWAFGTLIGGAYGAAVEVIPTLSQGGGLPFGTAVFGFMHEGVLPGLGVEEPHANKDHEEEGNELLTHLIYGFATEIVRDQVRRRLDR